MYTTAQLNKMNKETLVSNFEVLQDKLGSLSSEPLTGTQIEKAILNLQQRAIDAKTEIEVAKLEYEKAIEKLQSEKEIKLKELQLEFDSNNGKNVLEINAELKALEEGVAKAKSNLDFGLKNKELEIKEASDKLEAQFKEKSEKLEEDYKSRKEAIEEHIESIKEQRDSIIEKSNAEIAKIKLENERTLEQIAYEHKLAIRDKNFTTAETLAAELSMVIIDKEEYEELEDFKKESEESVNNKIEISVKEAESKLHSKYNSELSKVKSESDLKIQLLEKDKEYLTNENKSLKERIESLQDELAKVPGQIKEAVAAGKSEINVNQDNKK